MNAERLHAVAIKLKNELSKRGTVAALEALTTALQQIVQSNNQTTQQNLVNHRQAFFDSVKNNDTDSFPPAWRQILIDIGAEDLFGSKLKNTVQQILADNQMTPGVAYSELQKILDRLRKFRNSLDQLVSALGELNIGSEKLGPGEAEIAFLIPREAVNSGLWELIDEMKEFKFFLNTLSEVALGHPEDLTVRTLSSSNFMVFLLANARTAEIVAKCVDFVVKQYKRILEIRKLQGEIDRLEVPESISKDMKSFANAEMEKRLDAFSIEIVNEYVTDDGHRRNELRTATKVTLNGIANRIDKGFAIEVRIEPPESPDIDKDVQKAVDVIAAAQNNMQYMKLEGTPILSLPEKAESSSETPTITDTPATPKRSKKKTKPPHGSGME